MTLCVKYVIALLSAVFGGFFGLGTRIGSSLPRITRDAWSKAGALIAAEIDRHAKSV